MTEGGSPGRRGRLTVYLGAAPGVGKTYAMLGEAHRRLARGTDVVVGYVETHGREQTRAQLDGLEVLPRRQLTHRGASFTEMDTDAILARRPEVVLVDELAHTNVPGSRHEKRAQDVADIRAAGIDVITTVNIQHLESLNDEILQITGVRQRETVPDQLVREADQIQLVDMSPEALRRRLAHGNVYRAEQVDASLTSYFRLGNLTALRELALLWLADRVDAALGDYRKTHAIESTWPTRERIVVAITGGAESETLLRRGARLAQRSTGAELMAVHVIATDGLAVADERRIAHMHQLTQELGGSFHSVVGEDVAQAVVDFAAGANATMILAGVSRHSRFRRLFTGSTASAIAAVAGSIDVHLVNHDESHVAHRRQRSWSALSGRRRTVGWLLAVALPVVLTGLLKLPDSLNYLPSALLLYLAVSVVVALVGGLWPAVVASLSSFLQLNWFFTPPIGHFTVEKPANAAALVIFTAVAVGVAIVVDLAARRAADATRARGEAATVAALSHSVLTGEDTADAVVRRLAETFGQAQVALLQRASGAWQTLAATSDEAPTEPAAADAQVSIDADHVLVMQGPELQASDRRVVEAFAVTAGLVLEYRRLRAAGQRTAELARAEATATALLRAVSHDLRTPLATMRTSVEALVAAPDSLSAEDRATLLAGVAESVSSLEGLIDNLLDLSRLQAGLLQARIAPHSLEEIVPLAVAGHPPGAVVLDLDESAPMVATDAGLLERVLANLVSNAVRHRGDHPVRVTASALANDVVILVADQGPGVPDAAKQRMFEPFQRWGDTASGGIGLGLAVARGLTDAVGAELTAEDTPGGGLTMVLAVPRATREPSPSPVSAPGPGRMPV